MREAAVGPGTGEKGVPHGPTQGRKKNGPGPR
jgi:hypothetical protein